MRCNHCKTENAPGMKFCHSCGKPLESSTIDRYPELKLKPTSLCKLHRFSASKTFWICLGRLILMFALFYGCGMLLFEIANDSELSVWLSLILTGSLLIISYIKIFAPCELRPVADYFQTTNKKYVIIIKDEKFGLYNRNKRKVQIPCEYAYLKWKSDIGILSATTVDGETYDIDINNRRLK